jgi:hypothetical protein
MKFEELVKFMVSKDLDENEKELFLKNGGYKITEKNE